MFRVLIFAAVLALAAGPAFAGDLVARQGNDSVRLTEAPCTILDKIVEAVPQGARGHLRSAHATFQGQEYEACWVPAGDSAILFYEDGDQGVIPAGDLKPAMDI